MGLSMLSQLGLTSQGLGRELQEQGKDLGLQRENMFPTERKVLLSFFILMSAEFGLPW